MVPSVWMVLSSPSFDTNSLMPRLIVSSTKVGGILRAFSSYE